MNFIIILFSLFVSSAISVLTMRKKNNKWLALFIALCLNTLFLGIATWILYIRDDEARIFGIGQTNLLVLVFSIPIITWINFLILELIRSRGRRNKS